MKITLLFLGSTGAGPVYSIEMAKALYKSNKCSLQIILSENCYNLDSWIKEFEGTDVLLHVVKTYQRTSFSLFLNFFNIKRHYVIIKYIKSYNPDYLYVPFQLVWAPILYPFLSTFTRIVATIHDPHPHDRPKNILISFLNKLIYRSYKYIYSIIILNNNDKEYVQGTTRKPVYVIPHASFSYYANAIAETDRTIRRTFGFIGRIEPYKGLDILVDAFNGLKFSDIRLLIAGSGHIPENVLKDIEKNSSITLINRYIQDDEFESIMHKLDFVVLPYKRASQSGVIPMSYAFGKTVVATNVGSISEQVPSGVGLLVEPTVASVKQAIEYLYSYPEKIAELGDSAKQYAETYLSWEHSAELLLDIMK